MAHFKLMRIEPHVGSSNLDKRTVKLSAMLNKIDRKGWDEVNSLSLYSMADGKSDPWEGFVANWMFDNKLGAFMWNVNESEGSDTDFEEATSQAIGLIKPNWGFGDIFPGTGILIFGRSPSFSVDNFYMGGFIDRVFVDRLCQWNLLSRVHLNRVIEGRRFNDWIESDPTHGKLENRGGSRIWSIQSDLLVPITVRLQQAGIIFDHHIHYDPWWWSFAARIERGDLTRSDVMRMLIDHIAETGVVPNPPRSLRRTSDNVFVASQHDVTQWLHTWRHPAALLLAPAGPT
ncbi:MAG: hypothetical protein K2Z80_05575 [Xanthobacteraceae bacterium]|nr:hypothetical protein [Xanthobacteraceae bacterium]